MLKNTLDKLARWILVSFGVFFTGLGIVGVFVSLLPTMSFFIAYGSVLCKKL